MPWGALLPNQEKVAEFQGRLFTVDTSFNPEDGSLTITEAVPQERIQWLADHTEFHSERDEPAHRQYLYLRLWTGGLGDATEPDHAFTPDESEALEGTGLSVTFSDHGLPGDFWIIAARPNTPQDVVPWELLKAAPPAGPRYFFAPLALIRWGDADGDGILDGTVQDCRETFRPLCRMRGCCTVTVGDGNESFGDVNSIRDAIKLLPPSGGEVCLLPGEYEERVVIEGRQGITIHGCGQRTRLRAPQSTPSDPVVQILNSQDITIRSLELVAIEGVAIELDETASAADRAAGAGLQGITLRDLSVVARDRSAILGSGGRFITVRNNRVHIEPLATPLDDESQIGRQPAIFLAGDDLSIEGNRVIADTSQRMIQTASGGIQIGGCSGRVEIRENVIQGGIGNGITLGSISFVPQPVANNLALLITFFKTRKVSPLHGLSVRLDENGCPQLIALPPAPEDDVGRPMVPISDGALSEVRIVDNDISNMGASGIAVVRFFDLTPRAGGDYVTVDRLTIEANRIRHCMRLEIGELPPALRENAAYGGIVLADGEYMVIRGNTIENNGTVFRDPICGIFILQGEGITIENNRVLHNGRVADAETRPKPGQHGGIIIGLARARTVPVAPFRHRAIGARQDGVPAARIHDNVVVSPEGRALRILAVGPVSVEGNQFTTHGSHTLNRVRLPGPTRVGLSPFVLASAAGISYTVRSATTNPLPAFLDPLGGAVVSIFNLGVSNEVYRQLFGFSGVGMVNPSFLAARRQSDLRLFVGGNILFNDNQVVLDALDPVRTHVASSVLLASQDDVSMVGNQCDCDMAQDFVGINALVFGWSVRVADNRFKEGIHNCLLSAKTVGMGYNTTIGNQGTHCILDIGPRKPSVTIAKIPPNNITLLLNTNLLGPGECKPFEQKRAAISASFGIF